MPRQTHGRRTVTVFSYAKAVRRCVPVGQSTLQGAMHSKPLTHCVTRPPSSCAWPGPCQLCHPPAGPSGNEPHLAVRSLSAPSVKSDVLG